jgi:hypothetical protein
MNETVQNLGALTETSFIEDEGLFWGEQFVANFKPRVKCLVKSESDGEIENLIHFNCDFADDTESEMKTIALDELDSIKWHNIDMRCQLNPDCHKALKYLAAIMRADLPNAPVVNEYLFCREGIHFIEKKPIFCIGDGLIPSLDVSKEILIRLEDIPKRLAVDNGCSGRQAVTGMMKVVNLSPSAGKIILSHCLLNIMRAAYAEVYKVPRCILFLVGLTGTKKTTYAAFMTQMYDRDKGIASPFRLNSSSPAFEQILYDANDCVVVLDDLFPAQSSETKRKQEKTLNDLIRIIGDDSGRAIKKGDGIVAKTPRSGAMVTSEYLVGTGSDAARLLPISFSTPIDNAKLSECQREPLIVSTFYKFFIEWFIAHYNEIKALLTKLLSESRSVHLGVHDRLQETHFCLSSAYNIFLQYCVAKGFTSLANAKVQYCSFRGMLTDLVKKQNERVNMGSEKESGKADYLCIIRTLCKDRVFRLADDITKLKEKHHGLIHDNCLCLRGMKLMPEILKSVPNANLNAVIRSLTEQEALKPGSDRNSIQISGGGGIRFLAIPLKKLN